VIGRVLIVGAGGLGGPLAYALAAAGARLTVCDDDRVELSNLQRQVQFTGDDLGRPKAGALAAELARRGGEPVRAVGRRFDPSTAESLAGDADLLIDGSDDADTKFAVADWAVVAGKPYVIAGVLRWGGTVFAGAPAAACYRCLFEAPPTDAPTCADAGVVGAACAVIGGLAARSALALLAGDRSDAGTVLVVDDLRRTAVPRAVRLSPRPGCPSCARRPGSSATSFAAAGR
jgi:molybdopterin/thiamine biosynthesis adenylyltransferase